MVELVGDKWDSVRCAVALRMFQLLAESHLLKYGRPVADCGRIQYEAVIEGALHCSRSIGLYTIRKAPRCCPVGDRIEKVGTSSLAI